MRAKNIQLTAKERFTMQSMIRMEIESNKDCKKMGIVPGYDTEVLKGLYEKLAGYKFWEED